MWAVGDLFRSRAAIEAEILTLRQQIIVLRRTAPKKQSFGAINRLVFVGLYRPFPRVHEALAIVRPATVMFAAQFSAGCTTNMFAFDSTGTGGWASKNCDRQPARRPFSAGFGLPIRDNPAAP